MRHLGAKPHIGFKAKRCVISEKRGPVYNGRSPTSASDGGWQHITEEEKFSPETKTMLNVNC